MAFVTLLCPKSYEQDGNRPGVTTTKERPSRLRPMRAIQLRPYALTGESMK